VGNACLDLCRGVACAPGQACRDGVCLAGCAQCGGIQCAAPQTCNAASGGCADTSCGKPCPEGTFCEAGQCKDACLGAVCPDALVCSKGSCVDPASVPPQGGLNAPDGGADPNADFNRKASGCACDLVGGPGTSGSLVLVGLGAVALVASRRRRRC
jgi:MYXO-CTERM domain-containing protein